MIPRYATFEETVSRNGDTIKGGEVYDEDGVVVGALCLLTTDMLYFSIGRCEQYFSE